jgi:galactokinase
LDLIRAFAPGRVNIIGGHTDYTGGLVMSMAIELGTTFELIPDPKALTLKVTSADEPGEVTLRTGDGEDAHEPAWGGLLRALVAQRSEPIPGGTARISTTLPIGAGLSSSAAFTVSAELALRPEEEDGDLVAIARRCQVAEQVATGVPCGLMDQITSLAGQAGHAVLIDCTTFAIEHVPVPDTAVFVVAHCGEPRRLAGSAYAERRAQCEEAARLVGPLADATIADVESISDSTVRRRARHIVTENERVRETAEALRRADLRTAGRLMDESHASLAGDFDVSTPALELLVATLRALKGVYGARITGAGFGGCVIALADAPPSPDQLPYRHWVVHASPGARRR